MSDVTSTLELTEKGPLGKCPTSLTTMIDMPLICAAEIADQMTECRFHIFRQVQRRHLGGRSADPQEFTILVVFPANRSFKAVLLLQVQ